MAIWTADHAEVLIARLFRASAAIRSNTKGTAASNPTASGRHESVPGEGVFDRMRARTSTSAVLDRRE